MFCPAGSPGGLVGYHVRLDAAVTRATRLMFCTTGILLRRLAGDAQLKSVSHVIVDEVGLPCHVDAALPGAALADKRWCTWQEQSGKASLCVSIWRRQNGRAALVEGFALACWTLTGCKGAAVRSDSSC